MQTVYYLHMRTINHLILPALACLIAFTYCPNRQLKNPKSRKSRKNLKNRKNRKFPECLLTYRFQILI